MTEISLIIKDGRACGFDPIAKAGLSDIQAERMQHLMIAVSCLTDGNGLRIMFNMDNWITAQLVAALFNADGTARDYHEYLASVTNPSLTDVVFKELQ